MENDFFENEKFLEVIIYHKMAAVTLLLIV